AEQAGDEIEQGKPFIPDTPLDSSAKHPEENHVPPQMTAAGVQKHGRKCADQHVPEVWFMRQEDQVVENELGISPGSDLVEIKYQDIGEDNAVGDPGDD